MKNLMRVGVVALMATVMLGAAGVAAAAPEEQGVTTTECVASYYGNACESVTASYLAPFALPYYAPYVSAVPYVPSFYAYPTYYGTSYPYAEPYNYRGYGYHGHGRR